MKYLKFKISLPLLLLGIVIFALFCGDFIPLLAKQWIYTASLFLKDSLIFFLPLIIFSCIFSSILEMEYRGILPTLLFILLCICISNLLSATIAYYASQVFLSGGREVILQRPVGAPELQPLAMISLPMWISNDKALLAGFVLGVLASMKRSVQIMAVSRWLKKVAYFILNQGFIRLIPLFVLGFVLKLQHEQILKTIVLEYSVVFVYLLCVQSAYLLFLYGVSARFRLDQCMSYLKEIAPSMLSGFSTMSSMVSLPLTLKAAEKNTQNPSLARLLVPMTVNNHLLGDSIFIPFVGLLLLSSSHQIVPDYLHYLPFALYFILAKFAVAAVPGGGIIVMIPILDKYLGLSGEMLSLITAIYILFDPVITAFNVAGNGAFAILFAKLSKRLSLNHSENDSEREKIVR